jgi:dUTP pyrophosphatase
VLLNHSNQPQTVQPGERIAQLVITTVLTPAYIHADEMRDTDRGAG